MTRSPMVVPGTVLVVARVGGGAAEQTAHQRVEIAGLRQAFGSAEVAALAFAGALVELLVERAHLADMGIERGVVELGEVHGYRPLNTGGRFCMNARRPSMKSSLPMQAFMASVHIASSRSERARADLAHRDLRRPHGERSVAGDLLRQRADVAVEIGLGHDAVDEPDAGRFVGVDIAGREQQVAGV